MDHKMHLIGGVIYRDSVYSSPRSENKGDFSMIYTHAVKLVHTLINRFVFSIKIQVHRPVEMVTTIQKQWAFYMREGGVWIPARKAK